MKSQVAASASPIVVHAGPANDNAGPVHVTSTAEQMSLQRFRRSACILQLLCGFRGGCKALYYIAALLGKLADRLKSRRFTRPRSTLDGHDLIVRAQNVQHELLLVGI